MTAAEDGLAPTLGLDLLDWMHDDAELVHGAGQVMGQPIDFDTERRMVVATMYELQPVMLCTGCNLPHGVPVWDYPWVCPRPKCRTPIPPMMAWSHYKLSRPKGWSKSGLASKLVAAEACGPVEFDGWDANGEPVGRPRTRPVISCFATEENQAGNTYGAAAVILEAMQESGWAAANGYRLDIGNDAATSTRINVFTPFGTHGTVQPRTASASAADGGQPTFTVADETHLWASKRLRTLWNTEVRNTVKGFEGGRILETTTMYRPGENSVAELSDKDAEVDGAGVYVDHRQAPDDLDPWVDRDRHIIDEDAIVAGCKAAYGDAFPWAFNPTKMLSLWRKPSSDPADLERYYFNRRAEADDVYIYAPTWATCHDDTVDPDWLPDDGDHVVLALDGSIRDDHTTLVGLHIDTMRFFVAGHWRPEDYPSDDHPDGEVPRGLVDDTVRAAFKRWGVTRFYVDPPHWTSEWASWTRRWPKAVKAFETRSRTTMTPALRAFKEAVVAGQVKHPGHEALTAHLTRALLIRDGVSDDPDRPLDGRWWKLAKPKQTKHADEVKIDLGVTAVMAYAAALDAIASGDKAKRRRRGPAMATF